VPARVENIFGVVVTCPILIFLLEPGFAVPPLEIIADEMFFN
jgi:hypothetical protein